MEYLLSNRSRSPFDLNGYGCKLYYVVPLVGGNAVLGLIDKYNAPAAVFDSKIHAGEINATLREGGEFAAVTADMPVIVQVDGKETAFRYDRHLVTIDIPVSAGSAHVKIKIKL
ncbi:MAG TPA: Sip1-related alpha-galactosidase [Candidatus Kryptobacter bacterium]|nr:Sip1-related alpha-galactosidase [Candidatus Kryptobacter bacterium]